MASTIDSILDNFAAKLEAKLDAILTACGIEQDPKQATPPKPITPSEPIIPPQPITPDPVITVEQPVEPPPKPSSIEKEKEISTSSTSITPVTCDAKLHQASSEDLCKLKTPR